jgi:hypothetical protein
MIDPNTTQGNRNERLCREIDDYEGLKKLATAKKCALMPNKSNDQRVREIGAPPKLMKGCLHLAFNN